jgi:diguanylate cyclase
MPLEQEVPEKARKIFERISEVFAEQNITPSPLNYQVWYEYFKGEKPKFRQEMDAILADNYGYNDRTGRRLFDEYLKDEEASSDLDRVFKRLVDAMIKRLTSWTEKLEAQSQQLDGYADQLAEPNLDAEQLKEITHSVLNTTTTLRNDNQGFKQALSDATQEIKALRQQLIEARAESMKDELTQLGNRKAFNVALEDLTDEQSSNPQALHLILTDIDHFKTFNDRFGHLVGDSVLRYFANMMRKQQKANQTLCRYGGEEFAIILGNSTLEQAKICAEDIRQAMEKAHLKRKDTDEALPSITASFGIAQYRTDETVEDFVKRADDMLYQAKQNGRNCVVTEFDEPASA